ncbi:endospore germination permease [Paenibacillus sp. R14(2021)]|uniref:GerAB/ArcD/ProY family transporter n=1 Tax=Paenibacillus sp. R14(2021) TaxID=2859228 RepID=UPI001C612C05|nr:endospore germination permease [Paenibacillus sp. R14(2021)]
MQEKITPGSFSCLLFSVISGFSTEFLLEGKLVEQDVWMSDLIGISVTFFILSLLYYVQLQHPDLTMAEAFDRLLGKGIAKLALCFFLIYILEIQSAAYLAITSFYRVVVLPNTPSGQIMLLITLTVSYAAYLGLGTIARTSQILLPIFIFFITIIFLFIYRNVNCNPFLPAFQHSASEIAYGGMISFFFPFGKSILLCFLFSRVANNRRPLLSVLIPLSLSGIYLFTATYLTFGSLGMNLMNSATFPFFSAIQLVKFGEYLERIEIMIIGIWTVFTMFELIVFQYLFTKLFGHIFGLKGTNPFIFPIGLLFFALAQRSFPHLNDLTIYNSTIAPFSALLPTAIIPLLLAALTLLKPKRT